MPATRRFDQWKRRSHRSLPATVLAVGIGLVVIYSSMVLPASFIVTALVVLALIAELWRYRRESWALPAVVVYLTVLVWYYADIVLYPLTYQGIPSVLIDYSYGEVLIFALSFRLMVPILGWKLAPSAPVRVPASMDTGSMLQIAIAAWAVLFICALYGMDWDVVDALFPVNARTGNTMWARGAAGDAGATGFLVSTGGYLYLVNCALFGILFVLVKKPLAKVCAGTMMALTWPFFLLCGTRNQFLAVSMPWVFCYGLLGRQKLVIRMAVLFACFLFVNFAFKIVVAYRGVGYGALFQLREDELMVENMNQQDGTTGHNGLNMLEELCYENSFRSSGQYPLTWGWDYFVQATGFVPRAIWPNKPLMGIEYAKARGFGGGDSDIGVVATLSTGLIGQGVLEFGPFFGPLAPAFLMALWCGLLGRWWQQRVSILRMGLFLMALGITFNLGRNITNITLWPVAFAYAIVRVTEKLVKTRPVLPEGIQAAMVTRLALQQRRARQLAALRPAQLAAPRVGNGLRPS